MKLAVITGITGQDGSYLADFLLDKNYKIIGTIRHSTSINKTNIQNIINHPNLELIKIDISDINSIYRLLSIVEKYDSSYNYEVIEFYNLAAQSFVQLSFEMPILTSTIDAIGPLNILTVIKESSINNKIRFYQASSSEMFGKVLEIPQTEKTPCNPCSPYGTSKVFSYFIVKNYRESYNMFACNGILFNHESPRRGEQFVTRKITKGISNIVKNPNNFTPILLGNLDAKRDWGHAKDYVKAMWLMLQQEVPDDYVICTGETHTVREFVEKSFNLVDIKLYWDKDNNGICSKTNKILVKIDPTLIRPNEVDILIGDCTKAKKNLNWTLEYSFDKLIEDMIQSDCF